MFKGFLHNFGDLISHFALYSTNIDAYVNEIVKTVSANCSKTLKSLSLTGVNVNILDLVEIPFEKVDVFKIRAYQNSKGLELKRTKTFSDIFPHLIALEIQYFNEYGFEILGKFPRLISITMGFGDNQKVDESYIFNFLQNHEQIEKLRILGPNQQALNAAKKLQNLKYVEIDVNFYKMVDFSGEVIHFDNVENVLIKMQNNNPMLGKLVFDQVNNLTLDMSASTNEADNWIEFVNNHAISKLNTFTLNGENFLNIAEKLSNSETTESKFLNAEDLKMLLEKFKNLRHLDLRAKFINPDIISTTSTLLKDWNIHFSPAYSTWKRIQISKG